MKRMLIQVEVEEKELEELVMKAKELFGAQTDIQVSDAPPKGAGATLAGVA